ncbi:MAG: hypothetical protein ABIP39_01420, partial [Polyangiaceae bacterium]
MFKVPLIASALVHATIVAVAVVGGHGLGTSSVLSVTAPMDLIVETIPVDVVPEPAVIPPLPLNVAAKATPPAHVHSHTHDYPVPDDHDDHPHDPSVVHEHAHEPAEAHEATDAVALPAAAPEAAPVFSIVVG